MRHKERLRSREVLAENRQGARYFRLIIKKNEKKRGVERDREQKKVLIDPCN